MRLRRRAAVSAWNKADGIPQLSLEPLCEMQPRAVARVVVLIMADVQGVRRLAQRMSCKLPPGARAQHVHAQLRVVRYRVFCAARRICLLYTSDAADE